jgi:hypothetical protein
MFFHKIDPSCKRISSCYKRLKHFAKEGEILNKNHPLSCVVENCLLFNIGWPSTYTYSERLTWLDWFASSLNRYMDKNRIENDMEACAILHNCLEYDFELYDWDLLVKGYDKKDDNSKREVFELSPTNFLKEQFNLYFGKFDDITTALDIKVGVIRFSTQPKKKPENIGEVFVRIDNKSTWKSVMKEFNKKAHECYLEVMNDSTSS